MNSSFFSTDDSFVGPATAGETSADTAAAREKSRLAALRRYGVLDTAPEAAFDDIVGLAAQICAVPIALVSLMDECRQWFKARIGLEVAETCRSVAFCDHAIRAAELLIVPDAQKDDRFRHNPLVTEAPSIRFYAGAPLITPDGFPLGTLCVIDYVPRELNASQQEALRMLSRQVVAQLELRRQARELTEEARGHQRARMALQISEQRFRSVVENLGEGLLITDNTDVILLANTRLEEITGFTRDEMIGQTVYSLLLPPSEWPFLQRRNQARRRGKSETYDLLLRRKDGTRFWAEIRATPHRDPSGEIVGTLNAILDITQRKSYEMAVRESEARFQAFMNNTPAVAFLKDAEGRMVYINETFERTFHISREELRGKTDWDWLPEEVARQNVTNDQAVLQAGTCVEMLETVPTPDGAARHWLTLKFPFRDGQGQQFLGGVAVDVTAREQAEAALRAANVRLLALASVDGLTGIANRRRFMERLEEEFQQSRRYPVPLSVLIADVDHFKQFNDDYGHLAGDQVLKGVARQLQETARGVDVAARFGGEEFVILMPHTDAEGACLLAERVRSGIAAMTLALPDQTPLGSVTISIGVATLDADAADPAQLLAAADTALYTSKRGGRNRVMHFGSCDRTAF